MYKIKIHENIEDAQLWKADNNASIFESYPFLKTTIETNSDIEYFFAEITLADKLVGKLFIQILPFQGKELKSYVSDSSPKLVKATIGSVLDKIHWRMAVVGNLFISGDDGQYWHPEISLKDRWTILNKTSKMLKKSENVDTILFTEIYEEQLMNSSCVWKDGFKLFEIEPELYLKIPESWSNFDDYLKDLKSKYRVRTKKVFEKSDGLVVKKLSAEEIAENKATIHALYKNVTKTIGFKLAEVSENYFFDMKNGLKDLFTFSAYYLNNIMIGFITTIDNDKHLDVHLIGLNYELNKDNCLYQRILYNCIDEAIGKKMTQVNFGKTAGVIKTSVGAQTKKVYSFIKHNSLVSNISIKPLFHFLKPEEIEARSPFKNQA